MTDTPLPVGLDAILRALAKGPATGFEICQATPLTGSTISRALTRIVDNGWATSHHLTTGRYGHQRRYTITQAGREQIARHDGTEDQ